MLGYFDYQKIRDEIKETVGEVTDKLSGLADQLDIYSRETGNQPGQAVGLKGYCIMEQRESPEGPWIRILATTDNCSEAFRLAQRLNDSGSLHYVSKRMGN